HATITCYLKIHATITCYLKIHATITCYLKIHATITCYLKIHATITCYLKIHATITCIVYGKAENIQEKAKTVLALMLLCLFGGPRLVIKVFPVCKVTTSMIEE
nr:unnamed protein product [Hydra vulgaris]